jgi:predicted acylesterase/phospholipase RssA
MPSTIFFSGCAFAIFSEAGAYKHLSRSFDIYCGTSSGAFLASAYVAGYTPDQLYDFCISNHSAISSILKLNYLRLLFQGHLVSESNQKAFIELMLSKSPIYLQYFKGSPVNKISIKDFCDASKKYFLCNAVNFRTQDYEIFSYWTTPNTPLSTAVQMSMSLIPLFRPTLYEKDLYIDGGYNSVFLPQLFTDTKEYKVKYPDVDIPIELTNSWGILHISTRDKVDSGWSFVKMIKSFFVTADTFTKAQIEREPLKFLQERTWKLETAGPEKYPNLQSIVQMYEEGQNMAKSQGNKGLPEV